MALSRQEVTLLGVAGRNRFHFHVGSAHQPCAKYVRLRGMGGGNRNICGQARDGANHLYYSCPVDDTCNYRSWSIEQQLRHKEDHGSN